MKQVRHLFQQALSCNSKTIDLIRDRSLRPVLFYALNRRKMKIVHIILTFKKTFTCYTIGVYVHMQKSV